MKRHGLLVFSAALLAVVVGCDKAPDDPLGANSDSIPFLVKKLRPMMAGEDQDLAYMRRLPTVARSTDPEALKLMFDAIKDPKADHAFRVAAFQHLVGSGGAEGLKVVSGLRKKAGPLQPWYERVDPAKIAPEQVIDTKTDAKGQTWKLFTSDALGNRNDLFISQKVGEKWSPPIWTGVSQGRVLKPSDGGDSKTGTPPPVLPPLMIRGVAEEKVLAGGWITMFTGDASLLKDTDGDGLTDIVEARLGTDPTKADTDGDGMPDPVDPCPNGPLGKMGDEEQIINAAVEASAFEETAITPAVIAARGIKPFQVEGFPGMIRWSLGRQDELRKQYPAGVNTYTFSWKDPARKDVHLIGFSDDHNSAKTMMNRSDGKFGGRIVVDLKKIDGVWFVTDMKPDDAA